MKRFKSIIAALLVLIVSIVGFVIFNQPKSTEAAWWNDSWLYRQAIPVTNGTSVQTNVYISVTLDTFTASTSMQADCGDFRFTREDGSLLPYYIVSGCRSASNVIHINFDSFPAGAQTVYFYYGNPSAENGFAAADFTTEASSYTIGATQTVETGPGPAGYWSFDEPSAGGSAAGGVHDGSGQGNHGTNNGAVQKDESECVSGKCLFYDGGGYVSLGDLQYLNGAGALSFSLWFKDTDSLDNNYTLLFEKFIDNNNDISVGISNTSLYFEVGDGENDYSYVSNIYSIAEKNEWNHAEFIYDGSQVSPEGKVRVYINGNEIDLVVNSDFPTASGDLSGENFEIGSDRYSWVGFLDEFKIFPYARSADQIKQDYNAGLAGVKSDSGVAASFGSVSDKWMTDGLVGYWKFDESATTSGAADASGNGNDGTFYGNASTTAGRFGSGGVFGGDDAVDPGDIANCENFDEFTISAWINSNDAVDGTIVAKEFIYKIDILYNGVVRFLTGEDWSGTILESADPIYPDTWYHIVAVYGGGKKVLYIDGKKQNTVLTSGNVGNNSNNLVIGNYHTGSYGVGINGHIDDVRIYNRALPDAEVRRLYEWAPGPDLYLKMDEGQGATSSDHSGHGFDLVSTDDYLGVDYMPEWTRGKFGKAVLFDGNNDFMADADSTLGEGGALTVSAWINFDNFNFANQRVFASRYRSGFYGWLLWQEGTTPGGSLQFYVSNAAGNEVSAESDSAYTARGWHYITGVYDGANVFIYADGLSLDSTPPALTGNLRDTSHVLCLGSTWTGSYCDNDFNGAIDDVRIYNYARTQKQILEDMNGGGPAVKNPVLYLSFDKGYGTVADDSSGYGKNLTISSATRWRNTGRFGRTFYGGNNQRAYDNADDNDLDFGTSTDFSLSAWVRYGATNPAATQYILHKQTGNEGYALYMNSSGQVGFGIGDTSSASFPEDAALSAADLADDAWHHIIGRKTSNSKIELFVDGVLAATDSSLAANATLKNAATLYIGDANATDGTDEFLGYIDEVRIYNFALNEDDINSLYNGAMSAQLATDDSRDSVGTTLTGEGREFCIPGDTATCTAPVIMLDLDEKSGTTAYDTGGYGINGTLNWMSTSTNGGWTRGKNGSGLQFDGIDDYVSLPAISALTDYSIELWYKPSERIYSGNTGKNSLYTLVDATDTDLYLYHSSADSGQLRFRCFEPTNDLLTTTADWEKDRWYHIAATYSSAGTLKRIYVNGVLENSQVASCPFRGGDNQHWLGAGTYRTNAVLDGLKVFDYERTPAQIAWDYNRGAPVAHWAFNECEGGTIHDESGNGNHGALNLGATDVTATGTCASSSDSFWYNGRSGKYKAGGSFDGTDDCVVIGTESNFDFERTDPFSLSAWIKRDSNDTEDDIFEKVNPSNNWQGFALWLRPSGACDNCVTISLAGDGSGNITAESNDNVISNGQWTQVIMTYDGSADFSGLSLFVNGKNEELILTSNWLSSSMLNNNDLYIGCDLLGETSGQFDGQIDEVKIFNYALTAEQAKNEYNGGAARFGN